MAKNNKTMVRLLDKRFSEVDINLLKNPLQGWIKTMRQAFSMTSTQLAKRVGVKQSRISYMEKNERNLKISTLEKVAEAMGCKLVYAIVPLESIEQKIDKQAEKKAKKIVTDANTNMALENQHVDSSVLIDSLKQELLTANSSKIWDEE